jgi:hypothetical protein
MGKLSRFKNTWVRSVHEKSERSCRYYFPIQGIGQILLFASCGLGLVAEAGFEGHGQGRLDEEV